MSKHSADKRCARKRGVYVGERKHVDQSSCADRHSNSTIDLSGSTRRQWGARANESDRSLRFRVIEEEVLAPFEQEDTARNAVELEDVATSGKESQWERRWTIPESQHPKRWHHPAERSRFEVNKGIWNRVKTHEREEKQAIITPRETNAHQHRPHSIGDQPARMNAHHISSIS